MFTLGSLTLPNPKSLKRDFLETSQTNTTINNKTVRHVVARKEIISLTLQNLTPAQVNAIYAIYDLELVVDLEITETNLPIGPTPVLIDVAERNYPKTGKNYLCDMKLVLTEVI